MPPNPNYLIGYGERLSEPVKPPPHKSTKKPPYTFLEAKARVTPFIQAAANVLDRLPPLACPGGLAVSVLTLHPEYLAKSYFPAELLTSARLESIGSRPSVIKPMKWTRKSEPKPADTTDIFLSGTRQNLRAFARSLPTWTEETLGAANLVAVEQFRAQGIEDRIQRIHSTDKEIPLEIVLHASANRSSSFILEGFEAFLQTLNLRAEFDRRFHVGGLCFLPMIAAREDIPKLAEFTYMRILREMPRLRLLNPIGSVMTEGVECLLPSSPAADREARVAIFDGGLPKDSPLTRWVQPLDAPGIGDPVEEYLNHGQQVTSAFLFGSMKPGDQLIPPLAGADHYRVLDTKSAEDPFELYAVLDRIRTILESTPYEFLSLSIGPNVPVEDKEVHGWTAFLDEHLSDGKTLATVAVGNGGENDHENQFDRIQVPSDSVNCLAVGASNSSGREWKRARYSSIGPGRSPGIVKPDILAFGGSDKEPFWVLDKGTPARTCGRMGTSYAGPAALRLGLGIRTYLGKVITPLAVKALLVHCASDHRNDRVEHGWGSIPQRLEELILCPDSTARILYRGEMTPAKYVRIQIPVPHEQLYGDVIIRATFCYASRIDPQDPGNYTRSGLEVTFRPHDQIPQAGASHPKSSAFFQLKEFSAEQELRRDAHKWETTLHRERTMRGDGLRNPVFDIHYNARECGAPPSSAVNIRYALVVSITARRASDFYNKIVRRYANRLQPLQPVITIPIRA